jgi:hypothetical protein
LTTLQTSFEKVEEMKVVEEIKGAEEIKVARRWKAHDAGPFVSRSITAHALTRGLPAASKSTRW